MEPTQQLLLGKSGLRVTRLGIGTVPIGGVFEAVAADTAAATLRRAYELGARYFDTAPLYGNGIAELRLGNFLRTIPRDDVVVATKVGRILNVTPPADPRRLSVGFSHFKGAPSLFPAFDFSFDAALRSIESSLERLGLDRVDVLLIHDPDEFYEEALNGAYVAIERLRSEGVIGAIGVGMNQSKLLARFARETDVDCFLVAGRYTLLDQEALAELLPLCVEKRISVIIGGVYNRVRPTIVALSCLLKVDGWQ